MKKTKRTDKRHFTKSKLALALGISRQLLNAHLKSPDCPQLDDVAGWEMLLAEKGRTGSAPPKLRDAIAKARLAILKETQKRLDRENRIADGALVSIVEVRRQCNSAGGYFMEALEKLARELPPSLAGQPIDALAARIEREVESIRKHLTQKMQEIGK